MRPNGSAWRHGRARLDLSAKEAAERLRIKHRYLLNIESNQLMARPSVRLVYRAAALYGVEFDDLVAGEDDDQQKEPPKEEPQREERQPDPSGPRARPVRDRKGPPRAADMKAAS